MTMKRREHAYIPRKKLTHYLLAEAHPVGGSKAQFFRSLGYNEDNVDLFEQDLLDIARTQPVRNVVSSRYGVKYIIEGSLSLGTDARVVTVWIIEDEQDDPHFVTAYPV